ncbi:MAG: GGDEF domain-containing protein [Thermaerobacter sp.]|nr:GGDEF domain-containing protein [Thermaerobacter sp.]
MKSAEAARTLAWRMGYRLELREVREGCPATGRISPVRACGACAGGGACHALFADGGVAGVAQVRRRFLRRGDAQALRALLTLAAQALRNAHDIGYLADQAVADPLTGLPNRRGLERELSRGAYRGMWGLLMCDIDHFKAVNDNHGHDAGDAVLVAFARCLRANVRQCDTVARWGGEEFVVLLSGMGREELGEAGERLRRAVEVLRHPAWPPRLTVTASFGGAVYPLDGTDPPGVIAAADAALYRAKEGGRNRCVVSG